MLVIQYICEIDFKINNIKIISFKIYFSVNLWICFIYFSHTLCFYYLEPIIGNRES